MKVLVMWPPNIPTYFNAGHHNTLWETSNYLRKLSCVSELRTVDAGVLNWTWAAVARELIREPDVLAIHNEFDTIQGIKTLIAYCREISPGTRIITFGRASSSIPGFFQRYGLDAIVASGDWEAGIAQFVEWLSGLRQRQAITGLLLRTTNSEEGYINTGQGVYLPAEEWAFPDPQEVPWHQYNRLYQDATLEFSGLSGRRELPITISRGCPMGCSYCLVPPAQGLKERRRSVASILAYADRARQFYEFDYISTYSPTFTLRRDWVLDFAKAVETHPAKYAWKTCTTLHHLDEALVDAMARSRCLRISVGLETLDPGAIALLPKAKRTTENHLREVSRWCRERGVELNCFVMLGMPGQTQEGVAYTFKLVREVGARLRPTAYTPYHELRADMDEETFLSQCRQIVSSEVVEGLSRRDFYRLEFGDRETVLSELVLAGTT